MWESKELGTYQPSEIEEKLYAFWEKSGYFHEEVDETKKPFSIVLPPPNVTGQLHMGHALDNTLQDILIRFKRMQGYNVLWLPGTDHAGIATQIKVEELLAKEEGKTRYDLGRDGFIERVWEWKETFHDRIVKQIRRLGASCDWSRERFTMDDVCAKAVREVFVSLYEKGLIYQGYRITNWCPRCHTALSDIEVEHEDEQGHLWYIRYPVVGNETDYVLIATTRPETMIGDVAVAVHPEDERYAKYIGKTLRLPLVDREIPIIADTYVDPAFGTGAVKITPAHDPNDFEMGERHQLDTIVVMNLDGTMNEQAGQYDKMDRYDARKAIVNDLKEQGYLDHIEEHNHAVGHCSRCHTTVEPMTTKQWFVKMEPLAKPALDAILNCDTEFVPDRFSRTYSHWLENIRDWCISRQLWWGHRIPAWYCNDCHKTIVSKEDITSCPHCGGAVTQDPDVLDTWFSSALWPFSTMGWPDQTKELNQFYPTSVLVTGYDIIFFWVARMMFTGLDFMKEVPFRHVFIHGLVRDSQGRKMSKSLGNGIDPLEVVEQYGADALRFTLITGNTPGNDMRFYMERVETNRNFANKIWNAAKFVLMNLTDYDPDYVPSAHEFTLADRWILQQYNETVEQVSGNLEKFELGEAASTIYEFIWSSYCDWYIELTKKRLYDKDNGESRKVAQYVLVYVLSHTMQLLHPFMPFITEHIWQHLPHERESIVISQWPAVCKKWDFVNDKIQMGLLMEAIKGIRNMRVEAKVPLGKKAEVFLVPADEALGTIIKKHEAYFQALASADKVTVLAATVAKPENAIVTVVPGLEVYLLLKDLIDIDKETERISKDQLQLHKEIDRLEKKLSNAGFLAKAPEVVVKKEKEKLVDYQDKLWALQKRMEDLKKF